MSDLYFLTAVELADRIRRRQVSVTEVVRAHLAQIERVNPRVNAIVTLTAERRLNPYDVTKTWGGSSGGAAVALACGMVPIADGSDTGGSLRNPAAFCNVVGLRTAPGRVPAWPREAAWSSLSVQGPMARTVADAALLLSAMAGPDPRSPIAITQPGEMFRRPLERDFRGVRVAWSRDLGGLPIDRPVDHAH